MRYLLQIGVEIDNVVVGERAFRAQLENRRRLPEHASSTDAVFSPDEFESTVSFRRTFSYKRTSMRIFDRRFRLNGRVCDIHYS